MNDPPWLRNERADPQCSGAAVLPRYRARIIGKFRDLHNTPDRASASSARYAAIAARLVTRTAVELFRCRKRQIAQCVAAAGLPELDRALSERSRTGATGSWK